MNREYKLSDKDREDLKKKIELSYVKDIHREWDKMQSYSDYFEEKCGRYREINNISDDDRIENEYLDLYELDKGEWE